jgi:hypothetical protein
MLEDIPAEYCEGCGDEILAQGYDGSLVSCPGCGAQYRLSVDDESWSLNRVEEAPCPEA